MKKQRVDSEAGMVELASKVRGISWPENVFQSPNSEFYFWSIIEQRPSALWSDHEIHIAAMLACSMDLFEIERKRLFEEGRVIKSEKGNLINNPRVNTSRDLWSEIIQGRRTLGLQEAAKGTPKNREQNRIAAAKVENNFNSIGDDDLDSLIN